MAGIDETLTGREQREDNYRKWAERAVVVGYNSENQSYDIVVTTERLVGANKRTLNKTIRRVKSLLDNSIRTFLPGEAVSVGYISDKREHPVILGLGDNVVQTPVKVTLGPTLDVEGETSIELEDPTFINLPLQLFDSVTGSTTTLTLDCDEPPNDFFTHFARTSNGQGAITFAITALVGCTLTTSVFGRDLRLRRPANVGGSAIAYMTFMAEAVCATAAGNPCTYGGPGSCTGSGIRCCSNNFGGSDTNMDAACWNCDESHRTTCGSNGTQEDCAAVPPSGFNGPSVVKETCSSCGPIVSIGKNADCAGFVDFDLAGTCTGGPAFCAFPSFPNDWSNGGIFLKANPQFGFVCDQRVAALTESLGSCCPCSLVSGLFVTATDEDGVSLTLETELAQTVLFP